jgi:hypothetical protein
MNGFAKVIIDDNEVNKLLKKYRKINKYMKSSLYEIKKIDGTEEVVTQLLKEYYDNPIE